MCDRIAVKAEWPRNREYRKYHPAKDSQPKPSSVMEHTLITKHNSKTVVAEHLQLPIQMR
jgi:hypothetical protein